MKLFLRKWFHVIWRHNFKCIYFIKIYLHVRGEICACEFKYLQDLEEGVGFPVSHLTWVLGAELRPLQEQKVLWTVKPCLQPLEKVFLKKKIKLHVLFLMWIAFFPILELASWWAKGQLWAVWYFEVVNNENVVITPLTSLVLQRYLFPWIVLKLHYFISVVPSECSNG